jgi:20S proteasome alpha/beta subunit
MTIAAGFVSTDGVLLCADTMYTDGYTKFEGNKIFTWTGGEISACFALAGNATIAKMAVDDCVAALYALEVDKRSFSEAFGAIRSVVKYVQQEYVDKVPIEERERSRFYLLVALHTQAAGLRLYSTNDAAISPVHTYDCIGAGRQIAMYVLEPSYRKDMTINEVAILGIHALAAAKEREDGVGGRSQFLAIRSGVVSPVVAHNIDQSETWVLEYRQKCASLLFDIGNVELDDAEFNKRLDSFTDEARWLRASWKGGSAPWEHLNEWLAKVAPKEAEQQHPQSTTIDPSRPQPSPE